MRRLLLLALALALAAAAFPASAKAGSPDYSFRAASVDFAGNDIQAGMFVQSDGKTVLGGYTYRSTSSGAAPANFAVARLKKNGTLDRTFSKDGKVTVSFAGNDILGDIAPAPGGKIILAGTTWGQGAENSQFGDIAVARLTRTGSLDPTFGTNGKVIVEGSGWLDYTTSVLVQPDGKIVVGAFTMAYLTETAERTQRSYVAAGELIRLLPEGILDPTFGVAGRVLIKLDGGVDTLLSMALQRDGSILVMGDTAANDDSPNQVFVNRYLTTGAVDPTFGQGGSVRFSLGARTLGGDIAVGRDGKIVVSGGTAAGIAVARLLPTGAFDNSFSRNGRAEYGLKGQTLPRGVAVQSDGKIIASGSWLLCFGKFCLPFVNVVRFGKNGSIDKSFGRKGTITTPWMWYAEDLQIVGRSLTLGGWGRGSGGNDFKAERVTL